MADQPAPIPASLRAPFELFRKEFEEHLTYFHDLLRRVSASAASPLSAKELEEGRSALEHRFHLIRGGAGFFKLNDLRELAAKAEKEFHTREAAPVFTEKLQTRLPVLIEELEKHSAGFSSLAGG